MAQFISFDSNVEVNGQTVLSFIAGTDIFKERCIKILSKFGISNIQKDKWYSQQAWLNALRLISENIGQYELYSIGTKIPETAIFPNNVDTLLKSLNSINIAYYLNHRGGEIGYYKFIYTQDGKMSFICHNPYPCEFDRGIIEGIAKKYINSSQVISVIHDVVSPCRFKGDESCTYSIEIKNK